MKKKRLEVLSSPRKVRSATMFVNYVVPACFPPFFPFFFVFFFFPPSYEAA
jgi:hypothetical protein